MVIGIELGLGKSPGKSLKTLGLLHQQRPQGGIVNLPVFQALPNIHHKDTQRKDEGIAVAKNLLEMLHRAQAAKHGTQAHKTDGPVLKGFREFKMINKILQHPRHGAIVLRGHDDQSIRFHDFLGETSQFFRLGSVSVMGPRMKMGFYVLQIDDLHVLSQLLVDFLNDQGNTVSIGVTAVRSRDNVFHAFLLTMRIAKPLIVRCNNEQEQAGVQMKIWFLLNDGQVTGPFEPAEIESKIPGTPEALIWGRGQSEWMKADKWRKSLQSGEVIAGAASGVHDRWLVRVEGKERPPMNYDELLKFLRTQQDYAVVDVKAEGSPSWREIYSVQRIVDDLGVTRRSHPRVPIMGNFETEAGSGAIQFKSKVISISEGGLGLSEAKGRKIGERFRGTMTSPNLFVTVHSNCEVVYVGNDGYAGLKFIGLPMEEKSAIIEYVNKFSI